jgi:hypothetical protein
MNKSYTLLYLLENFENSNNDLFDYQFESNEFNDVYELLNQFEAEPSEKVLNNILEFSKSLH